MSSPEKAQWEEKDYRRQVSAIFERILKKIDPLDPDVIEAENVQGAVSITIQRRIKVVVSPQPPVRQIWLAIAAKGIAFHFDFDRMKKCWMDDKGTGVELISRLEAELSQLSGVSVSLGESPALGS
jgi:CyaY protein